MRNAICVSCVAVILFLASGVCQGQPPSFRGLGNGPRDGFPKYAFGMSADGSVVVGNIPAGHYSEAYRWSATTGVVGLGFLDAGHLSEGQGASADGSVVVGDSVDSSYDYAAFRWTEATGMTNLGDLPGGAEDSRATDVSADGSFVVGGSVGARGFEAYRWTAQTGMVGIGDLPGYTFWSRATAVSADGSVVVGESISAASGRYSREAFYWTEGADMVPLGGLGGGEFHSRALGVSADGTCIVGDSNSAQGREAFRWTESQGMVPLGDLPGGDFYSTALDVTANGDIVVGLANSGAPNRSAAFIWDAGSGMRNLQEMLTNDYGLDMDGWTLRFASGISDDGLTISGTGTNPAGNFEAWVVTFPEPATLSFDDQAIGDSNWSSPANWDYQPDPGTVVPTGTIRVTVGGNHSVDIVTAGQQAGNVDITDTATLNIATSANPLVGDLTVEGIVTVGPTARLNVRNTLSAAAIDSSGTVTLGANSTVTGAVTVTGGSFSIESASAELFVLDKLRLGRNATFSAVEGSTVRMTGAHFENESTDPAALSGLGNISFIFEGGSTQNDTFEIAGEDMGGDDMAGLVDNFTIDTLQLGGSDIGVLQLVDLFDNQADGQAFGEALYVKNLIVGPGSSLDLNGLNLYYLDADLDPTGEIIGGMPTKVVPEPATLSLLGLGGLAVIRRRRRK